MAKKEFPIIRGGSLKSIPRSVAEMVYEGYARDYPGGQSLERLAERGGFGLYELGLYLPNWQQEVADARKPPTPTIKGD